jgi:hypothetical protein
MRLGSRAFDILTALVERAGEVVGKEELIARRAWPATYVSECPHASRTRTFGGGAIIRAAPRSRDAAVAAALRALYKGVCRQAD